MVPWKQKWISCVLVFLSCAVYVFFRLGAGNTYWALDEIIPLKIVGNIFNTGHLDTNWALANLPEEFKYDQYNFSSYILFSAAMVKFVAPVLRILGIGANLLIVLRIFSALFHVIIILLTYAVGKSLFNCRRIGVVAAWLVAIFPLLFQDSLYARPESFTAMLTLLLVLLVTRQHQKPAILGFFAMGGLIGFLVASKITFLALLALPVIIGFSHRGKKWSFHLRLMGMLVIGLGIGFVLGVPYALINWSAYLRGMAYLFSQYKGAHPPHGLPDGSILERLVYSWQYFSATGAGLFILVAILGWLLLLKVRQYVHFFISGLFFLVVVYFSTRPVFFERNFSFAIPILSVCVGFVIFRGIDRLCSNRTIRIVLFCGIIAGIITPLLLFLWKLNTQVMSGRYAKQHWELCTKLQNQYKAPIKVSGWITSDFKYQRFNNQLVKDKRRIIYEVYGANDTYTRHYINLAVSELGMRVIAELPSPFQANGLPPSTLYTYHAPQFFYLTDVSNLSGRSQ